MEEITKALSDMKINLKEGQQLSDAALQKDMKDIFCLLTAEDNSSKDKKLLADQLVKDGVIDVIKTLLKRLEDTQEETISELAQLIAEIAKNEVLRKLSTDVSVISPLVGLLVKTNQHVILHTCRALGNICYDNDNARVIVKENQGVSKLLQLLKNLSDMDVTVENLHTVASGCLLNLTDMHEVQEQALQIGVVDVLLKYMHKFYNDEDVATHCVLVLNCLVDTELGRSKLTEKTALSSLLGILDKELSEDVLEILLELFGNLAENDAMKETLVQLGFCDKLFKILNKCQEGPASEEKQSIVKTVCDLVVLVLTGDASMEYVYQQGTGTVYKNTLLWLQSKDENLQVAGALAAGNFARKDEHCIKMVQDGVAKYLLDLLNGHTGSDGDIRLQHAVLSALRNLAIPAPNKSVLVGLDITAKLLQMLSVETFPVVFKLLGTFRMLVDKQETVASQLGENVDLIRRLVVWCCTEDHPGVKGEAMRLLAWLVKNSNSAKVKSTLTQENALQHLVLMLNSEHAVMQNEALVALTLLCTPSVDGTVEGLEKANLLGSLHCLLKSSEHAVETLQNAVSLTTALASKAILKNPLLQEGFKETLTGLSGHSNENVAQASQLALKVLTSS